MTLISELMMPILDVKYQETKFDNPALEPIVDRLPKVRRGRKMVRGQGLDLTALLPIMSKVPTNAFHYRGSLTTPECQESVTWVVFENIMGVSNRQVNRLLFNLFFLSEAGSLLMYKLYFAVGRVPFID